MLILVAAIGVVVFPDALTRMHALTMASTAGVAVSLIAVAIAMGTVGEVTSLLFATALQAATNPVASTLLAQATYYAEGVATRVDSVDQLAEAAAAERLTGRRWRSPRTLVASFSRSWFPCAGPRSDA